MLLRSEVKHPVASGGEVSVLAQFHIISILTTMGAACSYHHADWFLYHVPAGRSLLYMIWLGCVDHYLHGILVTPTCYKPTQLRTAMMATVCIMLPIRCAVPRKEALKTQTVLAE